MIQPLYLFVFIQWHGIFGVSKFKTRSSTRAFAFKRNFGATYPNPRTIFRYAKYLLSGEDDIGAFRVSTEGTVGAPCFVFSSCGAFKNLTTDSALPPLLRRMKVIDPLASSLFLFFLFERRKKSRQID